MAKLISDIFKEIEKTTGRKNKIAKLKEYESNNVFMQILEAVCDVRVIFELPEGNPPFNTPEDMIDNTGGLYQEVRKMYIFTKNQRSANIHQIKRENVFIEMLESIHPEDAKLMLGVKEKKLPYKGITSKLVEEAFPGRFKYE
jgi:hypothetical protein